MTPFASFSAAAGPWQNFYLLVGTAAATLIGLMFVAITFGASLLKPESAEAARSFIDPTFTHFVQVLFTACLVLIPTLGQSFLGVALVGVALARGAVLIRIRRHMLVADAKNHDLELTDWLLGIVAPACAYLLLAMSGIAFIQGYAVAFTGLAAVTFLMLLNGTFGAWELMVWLAMSRTRTE